MQTQRYKLRIQPLGPFFFGGERTFGPDNADYFVRSNQWPQQTALLGLLRYKLLEMRNGLFDQNGKSGLSQSDITDLIGRQNLDASKPGAPGDFGKIKAIAPVLIETPEGLLAPAPRNKGFQLSTEPEIGEWMPQPENKATKNTPFFEGYNHKKPPPLQFFNLTTGAFVDSESVFTEDTRTGITKTASKFRGKLVDALGEELSSEDEGAFYKQTYQRFRSAKSAFVLYCDLEKGTGDELCSYIELECPLTLFGGEKSWFRLEMTPATDPDFSPFAVSTPDPAIQIILLSDAFVENTVYDHALAAVSDVVDFRHIQTNVERTRHYADLFRPEKDGKETITTTARPHKSGKYNLLARGSVLYIADEILTNPKKKDQTDPIALLLAPKAFRQIGYNAFIVIQNGKIIQNQFFHQ